jgi:hypothetical protein
LDYLNAEDGDSELLLNTGENLPAEKETYPRKLKTKSSE